MAYLKLLTSKHDEYYTPSYAVVPIEKYLKRNSTVWCPFDTEDSYFVKYFKSKGHKVIYTHLNSGEDFFEVDVPICDYIISNPPFSLKYEILDKLFKLKIPFAMLVGDMGIFGSKKRFEMFRDNKFEIMYFDKRISYLNESWEKVPSINPPFASVYVCSNMLPTQIVFEIIHKI